MMKRSKKSGNACGLVLVEVLVAVFIISISIIATTNVIQQSITLSSRALRSAQAGFLLEEGSEATKTIRDAGWSNITALTAGTNYYLSYNTSTNVWSLSTTSATIDSIFTRTIVISAVCRDGSYNIGSCGTADTGTKEVTVTVSWSNSGTTLSKTLSFYMSNIFS